MAIFNFYKTPKIRQYDHKYIYYNPQKEEQKEREERIRQEIENEKKGRQQPLVRRGMFEEQRKTNSATAKSRNTRVMILVAVIALLLYFMYQH